MLAHAEPLCFHAHPYKSAVPLTLSNYLLRELRSDHAGETGAVYIYKGIAAVAKWRNDEELIAFAKAHGATEAEHLALIEQWLKNLPT